MLVLMKKKNVVEENFKLMNNYVKHVPATMSPLPRHATLHTDCAGSVMVQILSPASHTRTVESSPHVMKQESFSEGLTHILKYIN